MGRRRRTVTRWPGRPARADAAACAKLSLVTLVARETLVDLRGKYVEMLRLRVAHDSRIEEDPRRDMAKLASRFPGALREMDELPLAEIHARIDALLSAEREPSKCAPWMDAVAMFHELLRGALCAKRWLSGRAPAGDDETRAAFEGDSPTLCYSIEAVAWAHDLPRVATPPRGRLTELVYERISASLGITVAEARALVFPRR